MALLVDPELLREALAGIAEEVGAPVGKQALARAAKVIAQAQQGGQPGQGGQGGGQIVN